MELQRCSFGRVMGKIWTILDYPESETRRRVRELRDKGLTQTEIARVLEISRQAVHAHVRKIERARDLRKRSA